MRGSRCFGNGWALLGSFYEGEGCFLEVCDLLGFVGMRSMSCVLTVRKHSQSMSVLVAVQCESKGNNSSVADLSLLRTSHDNSALLPAKSPKPQKLDV